MRVHEKIAIGAMGGLALVLLKLIEVRFLVNEPSSTTVLAAYLTYAAYIALGILVAVFFTDEALEPAKRRKNAFISGLLAPSVLLAVVNQGHTPARQAAEEKPVIPRIAELIIPSAHAQGRVAPAAPAAPKVTELRKGDLDSDFIDGLKIAAGQYPTNVYVLGEAGDRQRATEYAAKVNRLLTPPAGATAGSAANVVHITDEDRWLVTFGSPGKRPELEKVQARVNQQAIQLINGPAPPEQKALAASILQGKVLKESALSAR